jgi:hypothetical protein
VTWIEQLATKRLRLGAAMTIAVSNAGFSAEAVAEAARSGIVLRRLQEVSHSDVESWLAPQAIVHLMRRAHLVNVNIKVEGETEGEWTPPQLQDGEAFVQARLFKNASGALVSLNDVLQTVEDKVWADVPPPAGKAKKAIQIRCEPGALYALGAPSPRQVMQIDIQAELRWEQAPSPVVTARYHTYTSDDGTEIQRAEMQAAFEGLVVELAFQAQKGGREVRVEGRATKAKTKPDTA